MIFRFANPEWLWLLLLLPLIAYLMGRPGNHASLSFPSIALVRQISASIRSRAGRLLIGLRLFSLTLLIIALARPQAGTETNRIEASGIDILIAIDLSTSMWAHDFELNGKPVDRLTVVKSVLADFIEHRRSDRMGLVAFAGDAFLASPLTLDYRWIIKRAESLEIGSIEDGTAIGTALATSVRRLQDRSSPSRIIVLLTDGANNRGLIEPLQAAQAAAAYGIRVYTIGVGETGAVPYPVQWDEDGKPARRRDGTPVLRYGQSDIDLVSLQKIAEMTDGRYFHATDAEQLREVYADIDALEQNEVTLDVRRLYRELFWIPLSAGLTLLLSEFLLLNTRFRRLP